MDTMRAVRAHRRGGPEQLVYESAPRPTPAEGEALVAVRAASITSGELDWDTTWTDRVDGSGRDRTPIIPSHEVSGVVAGLGPGVGDIEVGDEVFGLVPFVRDGAAAEFVAVPVDALAVKPATVDHEQAAAIPLPALTAWQALVDHGRLMTGQHLLVLGGAGGVGTFAVQIGSALGAIVTATAAAGDAQLVFDLGATRVIDYTTPGFEDRLSNVDVVFDAVGGAAQDRSWRTLRPGGVLVSIVTPPSTVEADAHGARGVFFVVEPNRTELESIGQLIDVGLLRPIIDRVVALPDTPAAYTALRDEHHRGKIVIRVGEAGSAQ